MTSQDIYPLARRLYGLIPAPLQHWTGEPSDTDDRDRLANNLLMEMTIVPQAPNAKSRHDILTSVRS
jgi:hypothetical protein